MAKEPKVQNEDCLIYRPTVSERAGAIDKFSRQNPVPSAVYKLLRASSIAELSVSGFQPLSHNIILQHNTRHKSPITEELDRIHNCLMLHLIGSEWAFHSLCHSLYPAEELIRYMYPIYVGCTSIND